MTTKITVGGNVDPVTDLTNSVAVIRQAGWWQIVGWDEHWPLSTGEVAELLNVAGQYAIDADGLEDLLARQLLAEPSIGEGGREWDAADVMRASYILEVRRQYRASPSFHDFKKNQSQLALEAMRVEGRVAEMATIPDQPRFDVTHLIALLIDTNSREGRTTLATLLKLTLEVDYEVVVR